MLQQGLVKPVGKRVDATFLACVIVFAFSGGVILSALLVFDGYVAFVRQSTLSLAPHVTVIEIPKAGQPTKPLDAAHQAELGFLKGRREIAACQGMVKFATAARLELGDATSAQYATVIGLTPSDSKRQVLPILDTVPPHVMSELFMGSNGCILSKRILQDARVGDRLGIVCGSNRIDTLVLWTVETGLLPVPFIILAAPKALDLKGGQARDSFDALILRLQDGFDSKGICRTLQQEANNRGGSVFVFGYWRSLFDQQFALFAALKRLLLGVLSSLFLMAGLFTFGSLDILLQRKRKQMALLLALGTTPQQIRNVFMGFSIQIALIGLVLGAVIGTMFLTLCPKLPIVNEILHAGGATTLNLSVSIVTLMSVTLLTIGTSVIASALATRRVFHFDPIVDLKK